MQYIVLIDNLSYVLNFTSNTAYEILQEAMEQGLRTNSWEQRIDEEKMWTKNEWMNECNYRLKKIVIVS